MSNICLFRRRHGDMSHKNIFSFQEEGAQLQASFHTVQDKRGGNVNNSASWVVSGQALKLTKRAANKEDTLR